MQERHFVEYELSTKQCGDKVYVWTGSYCSYLSVVLDLFCNKVFGWALSMDRSFRDLKTGWVPMPTIDYKNLFKLHRQYWLHFKLL